MFTFLERCLQNQLAKKAQPECVKVQKSIYMEKKYKSLLYHSHFKWVLADEKRI